MMNGFMFFNDLISLDDYQRMGKEVLSSYSEDDLRKIQIAIFNSAYILFFNNKFEIPSSCIKNILEKISDDYIENRLDDIQYG